MEPGDKAGYLFRCVICNEEHPEIEAVADDQLNGPVCKECKRNSDWGIAWMKRANILQPIRRSDLNPHLKKRLGLE
jgi:hypothetical protein